MRQPPEISLVIPAYNESAIIADTINTCLTFLRENFETFELIIVNDGSTDDTADIVYKCMYSDERISLISYDKNRGKGHAVHEGMLAAEGDIVIYTDADLAYGVDVIKTAVDNMKTDVLIGSRRLGGDGYGEYTLLRRIASKTFGFIVHALSGMDHDTQCGFKCFRQNAAYRVFTLTRCESYAFDFEVMLLSCGLGLTIAEMPVKIINHRASTVRIVRDSLKMFRDIWRIRKTAKRTLMEVSGK